MSTSNTHQQSLANAGSETRPPMLERGSYIPWASRFRRYINRKREGPYEFKIFTPSETEAPRMQKEEDFRGDDLKHYEVEIEAMNLILISIPNDIYNYVDACTTAKAIWQRVEREALVSVYNRFAQLTNDLERNDIIFPPVTINTKFLNCLQPEWLKYVTQVRLEKRLTEDSFDDLFDYLQQFEKLVAHTGSSSRTTSPYYVTHHSSVIDYDDDYRGDVVQNNYEDLLTSAMILLACAITQLFSNPMNSRLRTSSNTKNQAIIQGDRVNIQSRNSGNDGKNTRRSYVQEEVIEGTNVHNDAGNIQRTIRTTSSGTTTNVQCYNCSEKGHYAHNCPKPRVRDSKMEEIKELSANICLMARIQPANFDSGAGASYDSAFVSKVQTPSTSYVNLLFANDNQEQKYSKKPQTINNIIGDDQIDNNIIFDTPNDDVNGSNVEYDNNAQKSYELEQFVRNAYKEAEKQQTIAKKVFEMTKGNNTTYFDEYIEADRKAKRFEQESQSQIIHDRDIIRDLEQHGDKLELYVVELKRQTMELQKTQSILKRKMSENKDKYHDTFLDLEAKVKKNVDTVLKIGNSLQGMFMLGPKPMSFYDSQLKHGLGYANLYTLKKAISHNPKLYDASCLNDFKIHMNVRNTENILDDATKSQIKLKNKMKDPIAIENKQNVCTINYKRLNALYEDFVPQKELSAEQKFSIF
ncbi:retrovirus-related pol polyprotein from transposon TNT 1-94 [Tanacetum coccineum]